MAWRLMVPWLLSTRFIADFAARHSTMHAQRTPFHGVAIICHVE
jgi:hypothetical protein